MKIKNTLKKKQIKNVFDFIAEVKKRTDVDSTYAVSGHTALFTIVSFFPLLVLLLSTVNYLPIEKEQVMKFVKQLGSGTIVNIIEKAIDDIYIRSGRFTITIATIFLLWTSSAVTFSIMLGLNKVYHIDEKRGYFRMRFTSIFYTVVFVIVLASALVLLVFSNAIINILAKYIPFVWQIKDALLLFTKLFGFILLLFLFVFLYTFIPRRPSKLLFELPGAVVATVGWYIFSFGYGLYIDNFANVSYVYGSLTAVVLLMVWLYFCMFMFFIGAEINDILRSMGYCKDMRRKFLLKKKVKKCIKSQKK